MEARRQDLLNSLGLLALRVGMGGFLMTHGWGKVEMVFAGKFSDFGDPIGLGNTLSLILAASAEFLCSLLVVLGAATRLAALPPAFTMLVAAFVVHGSDPWTMGEGASKEPALLFLSGFLAIFFCGAGRFSVDGILWPRWRARRQAAAS
jgi:putative oxidoreductase